MVLDQKWKTEMIRAEISGPQGKAEEIWQLRMNPPFGFELQVLEGPSKGSKQTHTYVPMADKTNVIVVGDFHRQGASDEDIRKGTLGSFEKVFSEDNAALQDFYDAPRPFPLPVAAR